LSPLSTGRPSPADPVLIDTHAWIWFQLGLPALSRAGVTLIADACKYRRAYLSAISILELGYLEAAHRIELYTPIAQFVEIALGPQAFQLLPLTPEIAIASTRLPGELHRDPADRILAATASVENLTLLTRDQRLLDYARSPHLRARRV
jgi:PIN domain nuclease of toxin-antitoxin system